MQKDIADLKDRVSKLTPAAMARSDKQLLLDSNEKTNLLTADYNDANIEFAEYVDDNTDNIPLKSEEEKVLSLQKNEREIIQKALEKNKGKRTQTAKDLEISERTLYRRLKEFGLDEYNVG